MLWSLAEAAQRLGARLTGNGEVRPTSLSLDTRTLAPGACFVALRAERDGHAFAAQAVEKGAAALLVDHELPLPCPQLIVEGTLVALQAWGQGRLAQVAPSQVFGITGSVGKTSTKELLAAATGAWKTPGNRNNTLGLPEALATLPDATRAVVLEMGMSTPGEIRRLTEIAPLDYGLITMIGTAHIENFSEGQQGIAKAKGELVAGLKPGGAWAHLAADPWCRWIAHQPWASHARPLPVGPNEPWGWTNARSLGAQGEAFTLVTPHGRAEVRLKLRGAHQVRNAALAGALAVAAGHDLERVTEGLGSVEPEPGRGRLHALRHGGWLLDETYNASPDSILACAAALLEVEGGEPVAVLGSMRELGEEAARIHVETGEGLRGMRFSRLWAYGDHAQDLVQGFGSGRAFPTFEALCDELETVPLEGRILVKGSRFWRAERVVAWLLEKDGSASHP